MDGQSVRPIGPRGYYIGAAFTCTGDVIGVNLRSVVHVFSAADGELLRSWATGFICADMTVVNNRLYVKCNNKVQVFE